MAGSSFFRLLAAAVSAAISFALFGAAPARATDREVVIAYQDVVLPRRCARATGEVERATGHKMTHRQLASGADVVRAIASGSVQVDEAGSSPVVAGVSQGVDLSLFWILDNINDTEALVTRDGSGVSHVADLKGKTLDVPHVSTSHFHALVTLQQAGLEPRDVKVVNLRPQELSAARDQGDVGAAFIWDPVLAKVKKTGTVLTTSGKIAAATGKSTFDGFVANRRFARDHTEFIAKFVEVLAKADAAYHDNKAAWTATSLQVATVAKTSGATAADVLASFALYAFPDAAEQASKRWLGGGAQPGTAQSLLATAQFLKMQGTIQTVLPDYAATTDSRFVQRATNATNKGIAAAA